jgi:hypothetical protein
MRVQYGLFSLVQCIVAYDVPEQTHYKFNNGAVFYVNNIKVFT